MAYRFGSHCSVAGGLFKAVEEAHTVGCDCVQIFTKNNNQWKAKPITEEDIKNFRGALEKYSIEAPLSHASYLINLASPDEELWNKSIDAMAIEWQRAELLGLIGVVVHPGAFVSSDEKSGLARIQQAIPKIYKLVKPKVSRLLLENTAGQGSCLGWSMEQLGNMLSKIDEKMMVGVCIDTCHAHAAGYDLNDPQQFKRLIHEATEHGCSTVFMPFTSTIARKKQVHASIAMSTLDMGPLLWKHFRDFSSTKRSKSCRCT